MTSRHGGSDRVSTKAKLADEIAILGQLLTSARERAGLKQTELAVKLGVPPSYLSKVENGTRRLDVIEFIRIAEAMGVSPAEIVGELQQELRKKKQP